MGVGAEPGRGLGHLVNEFAAANSARRARARAVLAAAGLDDVLSQAGEKASRLADELLQASRANRELFETLIGEEVARAADRWGFVRSEELEELRREVDQLRVALVKATLAADGDSSAGAASSAEAAPKPARRRAPARASKAKPPQQHPLGGVAPEAAAPEPAGAAPKDTAEDANGSDA